MFLLPPRGEADHPGEEPRFHFPHALRNHSFVRVFLEFLEIVSLVREFAVLETVMTVLLAPARDRIFRKGHHAAFAVGGGHGGKYPPEVGEGQLGIYWVCSHGFIYGETSPSLLIQKYELENTY